jgi:putative restriction endonuclease
VNPALRVPWSHDELVIACGLYFTLPFGQMHARNPTIIEAARLLGRTPSSLAMKLVNLASLDPAQQARGIRGLAGHSRADERVWSEFQTHWDEMTLLSESKLQGLRARHSSDTAVHKAAVADGDFPTDIESIVRVRTMQGFFRKLILAAYNSRCCITGNPVEDLLVASHILPWSGFPKERLNPRNGLCLAAHFDRAFDRGLIGFDDRLQLMLSPVLRRCLPNHAIESEFVQREGQALICPDRFLPELEFIAYHRSNIFRIALG